MEKNTQHKEFETWNSPVFDNYSEKIIEDAYIDAYSEFANGRSFCMELNVIVKPRFFLKSVTGFMITVRIFDDREDMMNYINRNGGDKFIEVFYATK